MIASDFPAPALHGGPDALGVPLHDFSTNSNACGPCPGTWAAVQQADATRYPDPRYTALRAQLAAFHGVDPERVLVAGSASECIFRLTAWAARQGVRQVQLPLHAYGDYRQAAQAWGLAVHCGAPGPGAAPQEATLSWACEPSSPLGQTPADLADWAAHCAPGLGVLDRAYAPLRLSGVPALAPAARDAVWQLFSPNKALGLTGVRGAYAIAPRQAQAAVAQLEALSPSWPLGAHAVALLASWCQADTQHWLAASRATLRRWKAAQQARCEALGWTVLPSAANFFCVRDLLPPGSPPGAGAALVAALRAQGIKVRDAQSFGLPGHWRLGVLPPAAQAALDVAVRQGASLAPQA